MNALRFGIVRLLAGLFVGAALLASANVSCALTAPAKIAYIEGVVLVLRHGEKQSVRAEVGMSLFFGDLVRTVKGKCQINLTASGIVRLSPNSSVLLPTEENQSDKISVMRMLEGKTRTNFWNMYRDISIEVGIFRAEREIERVRAEGNALLDAIRADLQAREGQAINWPCANTACHSDGPHRWTPDGWECACGTTVMRLSEFPTARGAYAKVRGTYLQRLQEMEAQVKTERDKLGADFEVRSASLVAGVQG